MNCPSTKNKYAVRLNTELYLNNLMIILKGRYKATIAVVAVRPSWDAMNSRG